MTTSDKPENAPASAGFELQHKVEQFLFQEARLLNERRWHEWLELFTPQGMYWVPREHGQTDPRQHISLFWENAMLREVRVRRLTNPRNWSQQPPTHSVRVLGNVMIDAQSSGAGELTVHSTFQMMEWRKTEPRMYAGTYTHTLRQAGGAFRMQCKRVDLVNCDAVHENLQVFI